MSNPDADLLSEMERDYAARGYECTTCGWGNDDEDEDECEGCRERREAEEYEKE